MPFLNPCECARARQNSPGSECPICRPPIDIACLMTNLMWSALFDGHMWRRGCLVLPGLAGGAHAVIIATHACRLSIPLWRAIHIKDAGNATHTGPPLVQVMLAVAIRKEQLVVPENIPAEVRNLVQRCLDLDPVRRPSFETVVSTLHDMGPTCQKATEESAGIVTVARQAAQAQQRPSRERCVSMSPFAKR